MISFIVLAFIPLLSVSVSGLAILPATSNSTLAARHLEARAPLEGVITNCVESGSFAMTFDDGPYAYGAEIADFFNQQNSRASFFVDGNNWDCIYNHADSLIARYQAGHMIGSHTWTHVDITTLTATQLHNQLDLVEIALQKILGIKPRFFRPPYGAYNDASLAVLSERGYRIVSWSFDSGDSTGMLAPQSIQDYAQLEATYPAPVIALNHETTQLTAEQIVPIVVPRLLAKGWRLVTVAECLGESPYQSVEQASAWDDTWTCDGTLQPGAP